MEGLKLLVRNLAFILLLATFLELLLPNKSMRGFVQLVMGLFVIAAIIDPLAQFLKMDFATEVPAWAMTSAEEMPVLATEGETKNPGNSAVREQYQRILNNQIRILVLAVDGVSSAEVDVKLEEDSQGFSDYPDIKQVYVVYSSQNVNIPPIEPVVIETGGQIEDVSAGSGKAQEIKKQISALMQIAEEIIIVQEKT